MAPSFLLGWTLFFTPRHYYGIMLVVRVSVYRIRPRVRIFIDISGFSANLYMHWHCGDLIWDCLWANFVNFGQSYMPATRSFFFLFFFCFFYFRTITLVNINEFSRNLVCALILWRSGLGLLMCKISEFWQSNLPATHPYFSFRISWVNLSGLFTKFDLCIHIVEIWFRIAHWQISSIFDRVICLRHDNDGILSLHVFAQNEVEWGWCTGKQKRSHINCLPCWNRGCLPC